MAIDLTKFKAAFPKWSDCTDEQLELWSDIADCLICIPSQCSAIQARMPLLALAHLLTVNNVVCEPVEDPNAPATDADPCSCDDSFINNVLNNGAKLSSATVDGLSVSFDNSGVNSLITNIGKSSPFMAWLAQSNYGQMLAALISRSNRGPIMAVSSVGRNSFFGDDVPILGHGTVPGNHL